MSDTKEPINIKVSRIKNRPLRRAAIVITFPFIILLQVFFILLAGVSCTVKYLIYIVMTMVMDGGRAIATIGRTAKEQWKSD